MANDITPVALAIGLDLTTPFSLKKPGSLEECLNYEIVDTVGYQRIDGVERSDGYTTGAVDVIHRIILRGDGVTWIVGRTISVTPAGYPFGTIVAVTMTSGLGAINGRTTLDYKPLFPEHPPNGLHVGELIYPFGNFIQPGQELVEPVITDQTRIFTDKTDQYTKFLAYSDYLRDQVIKPGGAIVGIHQLEDRLYAVIDDMVLRTDFVPTTLVAGDTIQFQSVNYIITAKSDNGDGTWNIYIPGNVPAPFLTSPQPVTEGGPSLGNASYLQEPSDRAALYFASTEFEYLTVLRGFNAVPFAVPGGSLPGSASISEKASKYQFINHNFQINASTNYAYGVNGAGQAFWWGREAADEEVHFIAAIPAAPDDDIPRHVAVHQQHLALGYKVGSVLVSVVGEPLDFSGLNGASEWGFGDEITGLLEVQGTTLAVFCKGKIDAIEGTSILDFHTKTLCAKVGALEYTAVDMGEVVFTTTSGVCALSQAIEYGDFVRGRASSQIYPLIKDRLRRPAPTPEGDTLILPASGVNCAIPVRNKNQYRLYFNDGLCVTGTMTDDGFKWTSQYLLNQDSFQLIPLAYCSVIDRRGQERLYISNANWLSTQVFGDVDPLTGERPVLSDFAQDTYLYRLDQGWGFDGAFIEHALDLSYMYGEEMAKFHNISQVRVHGVTKGRASVVVVASGIDRDYEEGFQETEEDVSLPVNPRWITEDLKAVTSKTGGLANRGLGIKLKFKSPTELPTMEPLHSIQVLVMQSNPDGQED